MTINFEKIIVGVNSFVETVICFCSGLKMQKY